MKAVIQRCLSASVVVEGETISSIGKGLLVLVGIGHDDTPSDSSQLIRKILNLRLFDADAEPLPAETSTLPDSAPSSIMPTVSPETGVAEGSVSTPVKERSRAWKRSVMDIDGEVLCVSQFTLMARTEKGSKPDFHQAMPGPSSKPMYDDFLVGLGKAYKPEKIKGGKFAAMMNVSLCNEGPVTILLDTKSSSGSSTSNSNSNSSRNGSVSTSKAPSRVCTPAIQELSLKEKAERGKEKARMTKERKIRAKAEWEARKKGGGDQDAQIMTAED
ncbi:hypothetical protein FFLO_04842 [Filobasidium floriforme]|uniref:D-aminoacyl-tRNA deacylase n=1 Tax=Filobasidium floriforme TaxID=5210 RepID=A0A8K0JK75_9TREE|nr:hypothetical protein FFLO_04842 [Filobasidium floriforme]